MRISEIFTAGVPKTFIIPGNLFSLDSVPGGFVSVSFYKNGQRLPEDLSNAIAGQGAVPEDGFDFIEVTSTLTQTVAFYLSRGRVFSNVFSGSVSITGFANSGAHTRTARQVTNASQTLLAANAARKYLLIQNIDPAGNLFIREDGTAATADNNSLKLAAAGGVYTPTQVPTGEIRGILDAASAVNNVHIIEG